MELREMLEGLEDDVMFNGVAAIGKDYAVIRLVLKSLEAVPEGHSIFLVNDDDDWTQYTLRAPTTSFCLAGRGLLYALTPAGGVVELTLDGYTTDMIDPTATHFNDLRSATEIRLIRDQLYIAGMGRELFVGHHRRGWTSLTGTSLTRASGDPAYGFNSVEVERSGLIHAVGLNGEIWYRDQDVWQLGPSLTNVSLKRVRETPFGELLVCGAAGTLLSGKKDRWVAIDVPEQGSLYDIATFDGKMYVASSDEIYELDADRNVRGLTDSGNSTGSLSGTSDSLWSVGHDTIARFDGSTWAQYW